MKRIFAFVVVVCLALGITACGQSAGESSVLGPSALGNGSTRVESEGVSCPTGPVVLLTENYSPIQRSFKVEWNAVPAIETYQVEITHNRNGETPKLIRQWFTNRTEIYSGDSENGGRYYIRVRVKNACDDFGAWSRTVTVYIDGGTDTPKVGPAPIPDPEPEPEPEDDDNGNGNDDDGDDDSNPGQGDGDGGGPDNTPGGGDNDPPIGGDGGDDDTCTIVSGPQAKPANPGGGNDDPQPCHGNDNGNPGQGHD